jgi:ATP-dependent helicase/nuclease subunit A
MPELTGQQHAAVYRRGTSVVLSSGAGCGKTHVLTQRYLSHLRLDGAEVGQVVAITFTERAARQMRLRIRKEVLAQLEAATEAEGGRWEQHLRGLETAQISTIHAFCAALLRQHAVEAGLDPRFDVLEDYLATNLEAEALTDCLQGLLTADHAARDDLHALVVHYGWKPTVEAIRHVMRSGEASAQAGWLARSDAEILEQWQRYARADLLPRYLRYLTIASPRIARCLWLLRTTPCLGPKMAANVGRLLEETPRLAEAGDLAGAVDRLLEAARVAGTERDKAWASAEVYEKVKDGLESFRKELPDRLALFLDAAADQEQAAVARRFVRVAQEATAAYRQLKRRHGVLDFQDLLVRARDLLRDNQDVRERLHRRFRFLLIDELQDTDPVQMELVAWLCGAGLTEGKLFAVGDHSQSIYRFRGADVQQFQELRRRMPPEGQLGLTVNFRSQPAILDFVNALLGPGPASGLEAYEPLQPHHAQLNPEACVEFLWSPRGDKENVTEARRTEADAIARRIRAMIERGERLVAEDSAGKRALRPVTAGDIVLLFRAMSNVELYETALRAHGLDYYLVGGRAFFAQQEIYDLLNLLRALDNPQDAICLAGTLRSPFCCLSDEALFVLSRHPEGIWAGLHDSDTCARLPAEQGPRAEQARHNLDRWRSLKDRLPIARLLGEVFADSAYDAATQFEFLGDRKLANLWKLVDQARTFDRSGLFGLAEFIGRLGDLVRSQPREEQAATQPENADVVRLMTIHQAKGLEFPVVILPDLAATVGGSHLPVAHWDACLGCVVRPPLDDPPPFSDFAWKLWQAGEEVEGWREDLRTLYVGCTRAEDYLILSASLPEDYSPQSAWMLTLAERFDLRTGRCLLMGIEPARVPKVMVGSGSEGEPAAPARPIRAGAAGSPAPSARHIEPAPERAPRIFTVAELEALLAGLTPSPVSWQWDAEDGSDRAAWQRPGERIMAALDGPAALRDRLLRSVLEGWDVRDAEGWRPLLAQAIAALSRPEAAAEMRADLERVLARFAESEMARQLAAARVCYREIEFLLPLASSDIAALVRGQIDCLWQDHDGNWHLLAYTTEPVRAKERAQDWQRRKVGLVLGALAVQQQMAGWPRTVSRYYLDDGVVVCREGSRLQHRQVLRKVNLAIAKGGRQDELCSGGAAAASPLEYR